MNNTSWEKSSKWYGNVVGRDGHYYHKHVVLPAVLKQLNLSPDSKILDIGCGQGVLARAINKTCEYQGIDASSSLIKQAKQLDSNHKHKYVVGDATKELNAPKDYFTHAAIVLAIQNMKSPDLVIKQVAESLQPDGILVVVMNHPCFRIPRQSGWDVIESNKLQKRWVNRYMTPMVIPISMHPGLARSEVSWTFHYPLSYYTKIMAENGLMVEYMDELISDKESVGKHGKMENRSRNDIPLFLTIRAIKM